MAKTSVDVFILSVSKVSGKYGLSNKNINVNNMQHTVANFGLSINSVLTNRE